MNSGKLLVILIGALIATLAQAQIYKWKDEKGQPQYSESPPADRPYETVADNLSHGDGTYRPAPYRYQSSQTAQNGTAIHSAYPYHAADWNTCSEKKRDAIRAEKRGQKDRAEILNEWLWKNCREYSNELRTIEQQMM